jgi:2-iminoacetate synthase
MEATSDDAAAWPRERLTALACEICTPAVIRGMLQKGAQASGDEVRDILFEAERARGLDAQQIAVLLSVRDPELRGQVKATASRVHESLFARRVRLSDPFCPTNRCVNDCLYCPLRRSNARLRRNTSSPRDIQREVIALLEEGHRHLTLVFGEDRGGIAYVCDAIAAARGASAGIHRVQRLDINLNTSRPEDLGQLVATGGVSTYHVYQETYDPQVYARLHPAGTKADYEWRITSHHRACEAGITDLGLGVLLGLGEPRFDVLAVIEHARNLLDSHPTASLAISYPRLLPATDAPASLDETWTVDDDQFVFLVAVTRLAMPLVEVILNTPAPSQVRRELYAVGVSQVAVGSLSYPGVYSSDGEPTAASSLRIGRPRNLEALVYRMCEVGFVPNFSVDRVAQPRQPVGVNDHHPDQYPIHRTAANSLLALHEYMLDLAATTGRDLLAGTIQEELARLPKKVRDETLLLMEEAEAGLRGQRL